MSFRSFISVDIEADQAIRDICEELRRSGASLKVVNPDIMHITLKFLGQVDESSVEDIVSVMRDSVDGVSSFDMKLHGMGAFPNMNRIRVVWVGITNPGPLVHIAERIDEGLSTLGFEREKREFSPHLTVARTKSSKGMDKVQAILKQWKNADFGNQFVGDIRLKKSVLSPKGPTYHIVEKIPF